MIESLLKSVHKHPGGNIPVLSQIKMQVK